MPDPFGAVIGLLSLVALVLGYKASDYRQQHEEIDGKF